MRRWSLALILTLVTVACASTPKQALQSSELAFPVAVTIAEADGSVRAVAAGQATVLKSEFSYIKSPGYVSVLVVQKPGTDKLKSLELQPLSNVGTTDYVPALDQMLTKVIADIYRIQVDLGSNNAAGALAKVRALQAEYKDLSYLKVLEVSALLLANRRQEAHAVFTDLKSRVPESEDVKKLQALLERSAK